MGKLFISYRHSQLETVCELEARLEDAGIATVRDENEIRTFASITQTINEMLASSHALLVVMSADYPNSRYCLWELTAAYIAVKARNLNPRERIFIINLGGDFSHKDFLPPEIADALAATDLNAIGQDVATAMSGLSDTFGALGTCSHHNCYGRYLTGSPRFVGRELEMWQIHSALLGPGHTMLTGQSGPGLSEVSGMGGIGKTLLAEEYSLRFSAAYPGGIFWLDAYGSFNPDNPDIETFKAACAEQYRKVAEAYGLTPAHDASLATLKSLIRKKMLADGRPCLWVVDDIPAGLIDHLNEIKEWFSPYPALTPTLVTTRSREYGSIGKELALDVLDDNAALDLLEHHEIDIVAEHDAALRLINTLGGHALALDIAGALIRQQGCSIACYLDDLQSGPIELLDLPRELGTALPTGCERSIVTSLMRSILKLNEPSLDFLRLAANLAPAPIRNQFVELVFRHGDDCEENESKKVTNRALAGCDQLSLARGNDGFWSVHALVAATIHYLGEAQGERGAQLRSVAIRMLSKLLETDQKDITYADTLFIAPEVEHARHITTKIATDEELALLKSLGTFDHYRGNPQLAVNDWRKIHAYNEATHGPGHPATLISMNNLAATLGKMGDHAGAKALQELELEQCRKKLGEDHPDTLTSMNNLALTLKARGDNHGAKELLLQVLERRKEILGPEHPNTLTSMSNLTLTLKAMGDNHGTKELLLQVLERRKEILGPEHPDTLTSMSNLAATLREMGDNHGAKALEVEVLERRKEILGPEHPDTLTSMNNLASTLNVMGDNHGAKALHVEELERMKEIFDRDHPDTLTSMNNLASTLREMGDNHGAKALEVEVLERRKEIQGPDHPDTLTSMNNLALTLKARGDNHGAKELLLQVLKRRKEIFDRDHPDTLTSMNTLASILWEMGDNHGAKALEVEVLERRKEIQGPDHPDTLTSMNNLALTLKTMGDNHGAKELQVEVLERRKEIFGPDHPDTTGAAWNLFMTFRQMVDHSAAKQVLSDDLVWLLKDDVKIHSSDHKQIRDMLLQIIASKNSGSSFDEALALIDDEEWQKASDILTPLLKTLSAETQDGKNPGVSIVAWNLFLCCHHLDETDIAKQLLKEHLLCLTEISAEELPDELKELREQIIKLTGSNREEQIEQLQQAIAARETKADSKHPEVLQMKHTLGVELMNQEQWPEAEQLHGAVLTDRLSIHKSEQRHEVTISAWHHFLCLLSMNDLEGAQGVIDKHLRWLVDHPPEELHETQQQIREEICALFTPQEEEA
jgi:hypothetical protein